MPLYEGTDPLRISNFNLGYELHVKECPSSNNKLHVFAFFPKLILARVTQIVLFAVGHPVQTLDSSNYV